MLTVSTAASETALTTLAAVKTELGITSADENDWLQQQIATCTGIISNFLNIAIAGNGIRTLARETLIETFRFGINGGRLYPPELLLSRWPVSSITSVFEDDVELVADVDYELDGAAGTLYRLDSCGSWRKWCATKVVVTYDAGWVLPGQAGRNLPSEIENACINLIKKARFARNRDPLLKSESTDGIGSNDCWVGDLPGDNKAIPADIAAVLEPYRNVKF